MSTTSTDYQYIEIMNVMFYMPAAVASSIVACRAFTSLINFPQKSVMHTRPPYLSPVSPPRPSRGSGNDANGSVAKKSEGAGNTMTGAAFRSIVAGIDAMDQTYSMD